ncbi:3-deoxy-7-phosphoheptulonate synthase [Umbelopsis sp. PMI_123]|nr:3-deoxy-7-phosphoheptulonate synthase [Umbelopsis sp. PMI_123]
MEDLRVSSYNALLTPSYVHEEFSMSDRAKETVWMARQICADVLRGKDDRLIVIVGPCSIHDIDAGIEYCKRLKEVADQLQGELLIMMRTYFEKPRTTVGWKGLINDPDINGSYNINKGLRIARGFLCQITDYGMPVACELLDTISPQYLADLISWAAIGARTTESQLHRELASGVSFPVGFKNGTDGNINIAVDAIRAASSPHHFLGVASNGTLALTNTKGNSCCHVILRGGNDGPNYEKKYIDQTNAQLEKAKLPHNIMVDCSHGNSNKKHTNQPIVSANLASQIAAGDQSICGLMIESNINEGRQDVPSEGIQACKYGVSITDACVNWDTTVIMLKELADAVKLRRAKKQQS